MGPRRDFQIFMSLICEMQEQWKLSSWIPRFRKEI